MFYLVKNWKSFNLNHCNRRASHDNEEAMVGMQVMMWQFLDMAKAFS